MVNVIPDKVIHTTHKKKATQEIIGKTSIVFWGFHKILEQNLGELF
jgi:hypothetical protein